jgi:hypothetical protein
VGILLLVGVGILIGILLEKNTRQPYPVATIPAQKNIPEKKSSIKETKQTSASKFKEAVAANSYEPNVKPVLPEDEIVSEQPLPKKRVSPGNTVSSANESKTPAKNPSTNTKKEYPQEQKNDVTPVVRKQPEVSRISKKENLRELVHVTSNDYRKAGLFGGLKDVTVTASNNSSHLVDLAVVEVRYVLANGKLFKTDVLYFKNIAPKSSISLKAANSSRGARVESKLTLVTSKSAESISDVSHLAN